MSDHDVSKMEELMSQPWDEEAAAELARREQTQAEAQPVILDMDLHNSLMKEAEKTTRLAAEAIAKAEALAAENKRLRVLLAQIHNNVTQWLACPSRPNTADMIMLANAIEQEAIK